MFTLTITPKVGPTRVESFDTQEAMNSMWNTYMRCGINATPSHSVTAVAPKGAVRITFGR
jgi:hypothetical protein